MKHNKRIITRFSAIILALVLTLGCGGLALATTVITTVISQNTPPVAENLEYCTYKNVEISGIFSAVDPEGDLITYSIASEPKKGDVTVYDDGSFLYCPAKNKKGTDTFSYVATDSEGNVSNEAKVTIVIKKQSSKVTYSDMDGNGAHYAALRLAEEEVFTGAQIGDEYFFSPTSTVTRGEFLAMCLKACGVTTLSDITQTGFADDNEIAGWIKPYVATALVNGVISGYTDDEGYAIFSPNDAITFSQAAVILDNILGISDVVSVSAAHDALCPAWAYQATVNLATCDIMQTSSYSAEMTRADVAEVLVNAIDLIDSRSEGGSIWSWLF